MEEIRELYSQLLYKGEFIKMLSHKLFIKENTIRVSFSKNGEFKEAHIAKIKQCLQIQLQMDKQIEDIKVRAWELL